MIPARFFLAPAALVACAAPAARAEVLADLGAYAPVTETLAADPTRAPELAFVRDCASRLNQRIDRTASTEELLARFEREFRADTVHPATRLAVATLLVNRAPGLTGADMERADTLLSEDFPADAPALRALRLYARATLARYHAFGHENDYQVKSKLLALLRAEADAPWFRDSPELALRLLTPFILKPNNPCGSKNDRACILQCIAWLESIPPEKRTWAMNLSLGRHHVTEAWHERGTRWASETSEKQMRGFHRELKLAGIPLRAALAQRPEDSRPLISLMTISMADAEAAGGDTAHWMEIGRRIDPTNAALHTRFADSNMGRWCGDTSAILACYEELLRCGEFDGHKVGAAGDVLHSLILDLSGQERDRLLRRLALDYLGIANEYTRRFNETGRPVVGTSGFPINYRAIALAYLADADLLKESTKLTPYARPGFPEDAQCVDAFRFQHLGHGFARALACSEADDFSLLEEYLPTQRTKSAEASTPEKLAARQAGDDADLARHADPYQLAEYGRRLDAMAAKVTSPTAKSYLADILSLNRMERDFLEFKTVKVPFSPHLWERAKWIGSFDGESAVADHGRVPYFDHYATLWGYFTPPYELKVRINSAKYTKWPHVGLFVGRCLSGETGRCFVLESDTGRTYSMPPNSPLQKAKFRTDLTPVERITTLTVRVFPRGYAVTLNDGPPTRRRDDTFRPYKISIGALPGYSAYGRFEYRDLTIRRIRPEEMSAEEFLWMSEAKPEPAKPAPAEAKKAPPAGKSPLGW